MRYAVFAVALALGVGALLLADPARAATDAGVPSILDPASVPAQVIRELAWLLFGIAAAIFVAAEGALAWVVWRHRVREDTDDSLPPPQLYGSRPIEVAWTVGPLLVVLVLFLVTTRNVFSLQAAASSPSAVQVHIIGHQWWWELRYPELGIVAANELHVPVSDADERRPIALTLDSADVIHSFWVPQLAGKTDMVPNHTNHAWIEPTVTGTFVGQCGEFCGTQHANMRLRVVVESKEDFQRWVERQRAPAAAQPDAEDPAVRRGRDLFQSLACASCHSVEGTRADGRVGPSLTHLMSRSTLGSGVGTNDAATLRTWLRDPAELKPGVHMPAMNLGDSEIAELTAYLRSLD